MQTMLMVFYVNLYTSVKFFLYEKELVVYNVHGLVHLPDDVKKFGPLDTFSAFPFENFVGQLKRLVREPQGTLQQVVRILRLLEKRNLDIPIKREI